VIVLTVIKHCSSLHVTVLHIAVWMLLSHCTVNNCCLPLCSHVAGNYNRLLENTSGVLESPGIYFGKTMGTLTMVTDDYVDFVKYTLTHYSAEEEDFQQTTARSIVWELNLLVDL